MRLRSSKEKKKKENIKATLGNKTIKSFDVLLLDFLKKRITVYGNGLNDRKEKLTIVIILIALAMLCFLPFVGKAFNIDDPLYLWAAKHITHSPLNFYGFNVNWYGLEEPMSTVMKNPPLLSFYLALVGLLFGWDEIIIHLAMILPAIAAIIGIYFVARQLCPNPVEATLIAFFTPVFIVSTTTVMCDVMMLSFWIWTVFFWIRGLEQNKYYNLLVSSVLLTLAALTKYYGVALIPLLFAYSLFRKPELRWWFLFFLIPAVFLASYQWYTSLLYGKGLLIDAANLPDFLSRSSSYTHIVRSFIGLDFLGGCIIAVIFYLPFLWRKEYLWSSGIIFLIVTAFISNLHSIGAYPIYYNGEPRWGVIIQFSLFVFAGLSILALIVADLWVHRDANSFLLAAWAMGTFVFASHINWTINARVILPLLPPVAILIVRRLEIQKRLRPINLNPAWALLPAAIVAVLVAYSDYSYAQSAQRAAYIINNHYRGKAENIWYQGHWGFQYYMDLLGAKHVSPGIMHVKGDISVTPTNSSMIARVNTKKFKKLETMEIDQFSWLTTMNNLLGAGFYSDVKGPLPFIFGNVPKERYIIWSYDP